MSVIHYINTPLTIISEMTLGIVKIKSRRKIKIKRKKSILPKILFKKKVSPEIEKKAKTPKVIPLSSLRRVKNKHRSKRVYWG